MIINTDILKTRKSGKFIAIYGTQEDPLSANYDFMYRDEAEQMVWALRKAASDIAAEADRLADAASSLDLPAHTANTPLSMLNTNNALQSLNRDLSNTPAAT